MSRCFGAWLFAISFVIGIVTASRGLAAQDIDQPSAKAQAPRTDLAGDPLPVGAIARLGSLRLRHFGLSSDLAFTPDGKMVISAGVDRVVRFWDVSSGKQIRTTKLQGTAGPGSCITLSPDGKTLACHDQGQLIFWNAQSGQELKRLPGPDNTQYLSYMYFTSDGRTVVVGHSPFKATLWDWQAGKARPLSPPLKFKSHSNEDSSTHACFSPDGKLLAIGPHSQQRLSVWDVASGKVLHELDADASVSAFSPDSKFLAVACLNRSKPEGSSILRLYEVATGKEVLKTPLPGKGFHWWIAFAPDGKTIIPVDTEGIYFLDRQTGKELRRLAGAETGRVRTVYVSPDGKLLAGASNQRIRLWNVASGKEMYEQPVYGNAEYGNAFSPDGQLLALGDWVGPTLSLWEPATGRHVRSLTLDRPKAYVRRLDFNPDGKMLVVGGLEGNLDFMDVASGKSQRSMSLQDARQRKPQLTQFLNYHPSFESGHVFTIERTYLPGNRGSPRDGLSATIWTLDPLKPIGNQTFEAATDRGWAPLGAKVAFLTAQGIVIAKDSTASFDLLIPGTWNGPLAASPDHRLLAAPRRNPSEPAAVHIWEAETGKEIIKLATGPIDFLALVPDGRTLVTTDTKSLRLWDLKTGMEYHRIAFPDDFVVAYGQSYVRALLIAPDGRQSTTALGDGTLLVWELPPLSRRLNTLADVAPLWNDLLNDDAAKAYAAVWKLIESPESSVALLQPNLKPVSGEKPERIRQLLKDLDSDRFAARSAATKELSNMGAIVVPTLREALAAKPSLETRQRLELLLVECSRDRPDPERLRGLRAIEVLERIGSIQARAVLEKLKQGAPEARLTREAASALGRLLRFKSDKPASDPAGYWPQYRGSDRTNVSRESNLLSRWPPEGPPLLWKTQGMGEGIASVAVADGRIYTVGSHQEAEFAIALDEQTGARIWATHLGPALRQMPLMRWLNQRTPTVDQDRVYFVTLQGVLHCLRAADGKPLWQKSYVDDFKATRPAFGFCDYPLVDGGKLICAPGSPEAALVALDKRTGEVLWKSAVSGVSQASYGAVVLAEVDGIRQYVAALSSGLVGIAADGRLLWRHDKSGGRVLYSYTPIVEQNLVLCPNGYTAGVGLLQLVGAQERMQARELYQVPLKLNAIGESSVLVHDRLYVIQAPDRLIALEKKTGKTLWEAPRGAGQGRPSLTFADGLLYVRYANGIMTLVEESPTGYREKGSFKMPDHVESIGSTMPVVAGSRLYLRENQTLLCYDLRADALERPRPSPRLVQLTVPVLPKVADSPSRQPHVGKNRAPDAIFVPTPQDVVEKMLELAKVDKKDLVIDLGSGDGRIVLTAAQKYGAKAIGYEIDPTLVKSSREAIQKQQLQNLARIEHEDIFTLDLSQANVVTVYLPSPLLTRLLPQLEKLKPGTRIVSHYFEIPGIKPDTVTTVQSNEDGNEHKLYLWRCPLVRTK